MYVRAGSSTADPADSHVQARTAPQTRRQKQPGTGFTDTADDGAGTTQPSLPAHHIERIYTKTGCSSRAEASLYAMQHGLLGELRAAQR